MDFKAIFWKINNRTLLNATIITFPSHSFTNRHQWQPQCHCCYFLAIGTTGQFGTRLPASMSTAQPISSCLHMYVLILLCTLLGHVHLSMFAFNLLTDPPNQLLAHDLTCQAKSTHPCHLTQPSRLSLTRSQPPNWLSHPFNFCPFLPIFLTFSDFSKLSNSLDTYSGSLTCIDVWVIFIFLFICLLFCLSTY